MHRNQRLPAPVPEAWTWRLLRWFHDAAARTLVPTTSQKAELASRGFRNLVVWGRVSVEKNIEAFLQLELPGTKWVVGGGPLLDGFRTAWPGVNFVGPKFGVELAT